MSPHAREQLAAAHRLAADDKHAEAADAFAHLASRASERGEHANAMHLQIESARNRNRAGDPQAAVDAAVQAAAYAALSEKRHKATRKFAGLVHQLREAGHGEAADAIEEGARDKLGVAKLPSAEEAAGPTINRSMRRSLPKSCPACGMPVKTDKLEFSEDGLADCGWCGATLTA